jgi:type IV pilus assembly protein PilM
MAKRSGPTVGIEFNAREIRAVEVRAAGTGQAVTALGAVTMPVGAFAAGTVVQPDAVASALQQLFAQHQIQSNQVIIGVPNEVVTARVLEVPSVTDTELEAVVDGEIRHFNILQEEGGAFDYTKLARPGAKSKDVLNLLVLAAEDRSLVGLRAVAKRCNLRVLRFEPTALGSLRSAAEFVHPGQTALAVSISSLRTDIAVLHQGAISLFRRLDFGELDLVGEAPAEGVSGADRLNTSVTSTLITEIQRSMDYFEREIRGGGKVTKIVVSLVDARLLAFVEALKKGIGVEVLTASVPEANTESATIKQTMQPPAGLRFSCAYGLASLLDVPHIPEISIRPRERQTAELAAVRRALLLSLIASVVIVLAGGVIGTWYSLVAGRHEHEMMHLQASLKNIQEVELPKAQERLGEMNILRVLAREGVPFARLADGIVASIHPEASLTSIEFTPDGSLKIKGEAQNEAAMIRTLESLRGFPFIQSAMIESFSTLRPREGSTAIEFQIDASYAGFAPAPLTDAKTATGGL